MTSERNTLPGQPPNVLITEVRRVLWLYCSCRPPKHGRDESWNLTWEWAANIRYNREASNSAAGYKPRRKPWPNASEIATQYLFLALLKMRSSGMLKLNFRAAETIPGRVRFEMAKIGNVSPIKMVEKELT